MKMAIHLMIAFGVPLFLSLALTPLVVRLAHAVGAIDRPGGRKAHSTPTPRLGGVAVAVAFALSLTSLVLLDTVLHFPGWLSGSRGLMLGVSLLLLVLLGVWDDIRELRPSQKLIVQLLVSTLVYAAGFHVSGITNLLGDGKLDLGVLDYIVTVLWIVGVTNAVNLIDGLDGLASGVSAIALLAMFPIAMLQNDPGTAVVALVLAGAVLGFLRYNFNTARIFLGDSGSLFLGFMLAILSLQSSTKSSTAFALLVPIVALGLPIMDTLLSMVRRLIRSFLPQSNTGTKGRRRWSGMFTADRGHIHHQLLARGLSHRRVVLLLYMVSCGLGIGALAITTANNAEASLVLVVVGIALVVGVQQLRYQEIAVLKNGVLLPLFDTQVLNWNLFQVFLDIVFVIGAYGTAHIISNAPNHNVYIENHLWLTITLTTFIQFVIFWLRGSYKATMRQFGLADSLAIVKTTLLAVTLSGSVLFLLDSPRLQVDLPTIVLDFYFLVTLAVGSRLSFRVLHHIFRRHNHAARKVLIYGADREGVFALHRLLSADGDFLSPAGFLDDRPSLEGKHVNGYPVFGGHWKLERVVRARSIQEIVLSSDDIKPEVLRRLVVKAKQLGLAIRRFNVRFDEVHSPSPGPALADRLAVLQHNTTGQSVKTQL